MGHQDDVKGITCKEVCVLRTGLMYGYYLMYFYLSSVVIHMLSLDKIRDLIMYLRLSVTCDISAERLYVCETVGVCSRKWLSNLATTDNIASHTGYAKIERSHEI